MTQDVYQKNWGNLSTQGLGGTVRSGNISRDSALNLPATGEIILGALMTQKTDSIAVSAVSAAADAQMFIACLLDTNSIKAEIEDGVIKNFEDANAFTMVSKGLVYAAFDAANVDQANKLVYADANGVLGLYAADPGAGFTLVSRASNIILQDDSSIETTGLGLVFNGVTYADGITYRLVDKW